ncbi:MAG: ribosome maturation factor RimP [Hyphomicrobium aestuarii]|nr:ribosome maturation factor RimP [Hyphomicrobium aestuarii]
MAKPKTTDSSNKRSADATPAGDPVRNTRSDAAASVIGGDAATDDASVRFIVETGPAAAVATLIEPAIADLGFRLVRVTVSGKEGKTLQIMAERADGTFTIDDCETVSRNVSPLLDVHDPMPGAYRLEVSSPGIDRPLVRPSDFEDWAGFEARIELAEAVDGRKRFKGVLDGYDGAVAGGGEVRIECDLPEVGRQVLGLPARLIKDAKLVLTDDLIREALNRAKAAKRGLPADGAELDADALDADQLVADERDDGDHAADNADLAADNADLDDLDHDENTPDLEQSDLEKTGADKRGGTPED